MLSDLILLENRIKELRKKTGLNQADFGKRIGITKSSVSKLELGENSPSEQTLMLICKTFGVNEVWLRTGEGGSDNMFVKIDPEDRYSLSLGKLTIEENQFIKNAINYLADAEPEKLKIIEDFMKSCLGIK